MKQFIINFLGVIGYLCLLLQWMWLAVTLVVPIAMQPGVADLFMPNTEPRIERTSPAVDPMPGPVQTTLLILSILFSIGIVIYAVLSVPKTIGRSGQKLTQSVAKRSVPIFTKHKPITKQRQRKLVERMTWLVKAVAIFIPLVLLVIPPGAIIDIDHAVAIAIGILLASGSLLVFCLQYLLVKVWHIDSRLVW